jgi:hypothetical protein
MTQSAAPLHPYGSSFAQQPQQQQQPRATPANTKLLPVTMKNFDVPRLLSERLELFLGSRKPNEAWPYVAACIERLSKLSPDAATSCRDALLKALLDLWTAPNVHPQLRNILFFGADFYRASSVTVFNEVLALATPQQATGIVALVLIYLLSSFRQETLRRDLTNGTPATHVQHLSSLVHNGSEKLVVALAELLRNEQIHFRSAREFEERSVLMSFLSLSTMINPPDNMIGRKEREKERKRRKRRKKERDEMCEFSSFL